MTSPLLPHSVQRSIAAHISRNRKNVKVALSSRPAFTVDVELSDGRIEAVKIGVGEKPEKVAKAFGRKFNIPGKEVRELAATLKERMREFAEQLGVSAPHNNSETWQDQPGISTSTKKGSGSSSGSGGATRKWKATKPQPFRFSTDSRSGHRRREGSNHAKVLGRMHVEIGPNRSATVVIREGDNPSEVVSAFSRTYGLKPGASDEILRMIEMQIKQQTLRDREGAARAPPSSPAHHAFVSPPEGLTSAQMDLWRRTVGMPASGNGSDAREAARASEAERAAAVSALTGTERAAANVQDMGSSEQKGNNMDTRAKAIAVGTKMAGASAPGVGVSSSTIKPKASKAQTRKAKAKKSKALFNLDVNIGNGVTGRIVVRRGDDPLQLARAFCARYELPDEARATERLVQLIEENMRVYVER